MIPVPNISNVEKSVNKFLLCNEKIKDLQSVDTILHIERRLLKGLLASFEDCNLLTPLCLD